MSTNQNDPLAGVPAVDHSDDDGFGVHDWQEMYLAGVPRNPDGTEDETHWINDSRLLIEHIAWQQERIRGLEAQANADELIIKASADLLASTDAQAAAMREAINWMANRMGWVADCIRRGDTNRGQAKIFDKWSVIAMDAIAGDAGRKLLERAAAMRTAIGQMLAHYATEVRMLMSFGYDDLQTAPALEALQAALDGDAGCRLLDRLARAEQDLSQARADALAFAREARAAETENEQLRARQCMTPLEEVCSMPLVDEVCVLSRNPAYGHPAGFRMESRLVNQEWCFHNFRRPGTTALFTDWLSSADLAARELRRLVGWWHVCNEAWQAAKKAET